MPAVASVCVLFDGSLEDVFGPLEGRELGASELELDSKLAKSDI